MSSAQIPIPAGNPWRSSIGYGFQISKRRKSKNPAKISFHERVNGIKRNVINWPITSSTTACDGSELPNSEDDRPDAQMPKMQNRTSRTEIPTCIHDPNGSENESESLET